MEGDELPPERQKKPGRKAANGRDSVGKRAAGTEPRVGKAK